MRWPKGKGGGGGGGGGAVIRDYDVDKNCFVGDRYSVLLLLHKYTRPEDIMVESFVPF